MGNCAGREKNPCDQVVVVMVMVMVMVTTGGGAAATATCSVPEAPFAPGEELSVQVLH